MVRQLKSKRRKKTASEATAGSEQSAHLLRCVLSALFAVGVIGGLTLLAGTPSKNLVEHNPNLNPRYPMLLQRAKPQVILLGNSMLGEGVDERLFMQITQQRTLKLWGGGWASAVWYLVMKNVIAPANPKPDTVVIFFRDHFLTHPTFRTSGKNRDIIEQFTGPQEPLLERLTYLNAMNPMTYWLNQNISLFRNRDEYKHELESNIKSWVSAAYGHDGEETLDKAIKNMFGTENLLAEELGKAQLESEAISYKGMYDFEQALSLSFLPAIVELAQDNDIQFILVRAKRRREAEGQPAPAQLNTYIENLKEWCGMEEVPFIDFSDEERLKPEHYADGDHLNGTDGRRLFTQLLAEQLKPYLTEGQ